MKSRKIAVAALIASLTFAGGLVSAVMTFPRPVPELEQRADAAQAITWTTDLKKALADAKAQNKYVFVDVYTDWCGWCKKLDRDVFTDADMVSYLGEKYICVKMDAEGSKENEKVAEDARVTGYPAGLVFKGDGKLIGKLGGYMEAAQYKASLEEVLARSAKDPNYDPRNDE